MNILFDTNIILDVLLKREPHFKFSSALVAVVEQQVLVGWLGATTITTIYYLVEKETNRKTANLAIKKILSLFNIASVSRVVLEEATELMFSDYEDAVLYQSAVHTNLDGIVSRNKKDFVKAKLPIYSPEELLLILDK
ncbi:MAG: PIN domain-containing protein [Balneolaceae bacterium]|nr:PIN domain-containing protein [Balneolaceae bacterium]